MKGKLSISLDYKTIALIRNHLIDGSFRNVSHAIEFAVKKLFDEEPK